MGCLLASRSSYRNASEMLTYLRKDSDQSKQFTAYGEAFWGLHLSL